MSPAKGLIIAGLGPGDPDAVPPAVTEAAKKAARILARTEKHPALKAISRFNLEYESFDAMYETHSDFPALYKNISQKVLESALKEQTLYLVPGNPMIAEITVEMILSMCKQKNLPVTVIPAAGFTEAVPAALGRACPSGYSLVDAYDIYNGSRKSISTYVPCMIFQLHDRLLVSSVKIFLLEFYPEDFEVFVVRGACIPGLQSIDKVPLVELDRRSDYDHLTTIFIPELKEGKDEKEVFWQTGWHGFMAILGQLRGKNGCPWDKEQTYESLTRYILEEAHEVVSAVLEKDVNKLKEELGDLLLEIGLYCQIAMERGDFLPGDVIQGISEKMVRRHPHVFGEENLVSADQVRERWAEIKRTEKDNSEKRVSVLDRVAKSLPALMKAQKIQMAAREEGFDWDRPGPVFEKITEELTELEEAFHTGDAEKVDMEMGDLLFAAVNLARHLGADAESSLLKSIEKFSSRFRVIENHLMRNNLDMREMSLEYLDWLWNQAKELEGEK